MFSKVFDMSTVIADTYEITGPLDFGGGGVLYLGRHLRLEKNIVLKADKRTLSDHALRSASPALRATLP